MATSYQSRTVLTLARYSWGCPDCGTQNTTDRNTEDRWPQGRCGACHKLHRLTEPLPAPKPKRTPVTGFTGRRGTS